MDSFNVKLLKRSIGQKKKHISVKSLYADKSWAEDLDIINELGGHTGCVNALSWSSSGGLLASGSDDKYLNIWDYNPANIAKPFSLNTSVSTGHSANIFSVKFMPHSNDRTVVTCAGDSEVRVFDLEYGGAHQGGDTGSTNTRSRRFNNFFGNARWLNEGNTNSRVYRSHADRAKRIVTESSPHLFLTCSEDGEVRQWDLRQPSSAYPPPHGMRRLGRMRTAHNEDFTDNPPPPLISYKKYRLDLNSISCSGSQPHYIALGGAHLHCFLHDRRMLGRDISDEQGRPDGFTPKEGTAEDELMREATKCVRRFAPNNKRRMKPHDSGHITACKISDARPNELISSWSGDHIYSFDIVKSPDARDREQREERSAHDRKLRNHSERKRKRPKADGSTTSLTDIARRQLRRVEDTHVETGQSALRVRYENGETEDIVIGDESLTQARDTLLTEAQRQSERIARALVQLRQTLFDFSAHIEDEQVQALENLPDFTPFTRRFTEALGRAANLLPEMDEIIRSWSYPVNPTSEEVQYQNTLRRNRQASWRFVQAAGCLSAALGGRLQTLSSAEDPRRAYFNMIKPASREGRHIDAQTRFCFDFLKAILLWLTGGLLSVWEGFRKHPEVPSDSSRFPIDPDDSIDMVPGKLRDYLLELASPTLAIIDLGTNRFQRDELRTVFESQEAAVHSFARALSGIELRLNQGTAGIESDPNRQIRKRIMDKGAAVRFWGLKVGRSLLMTAAEGVTYSFVQHAFGGPNIRVISDVDNLGHPPHIISTDDEERVVESMDLVNQRGEGGSQHAQIDEGETDELETREVIITDEVSDQISTAEDDDDNDDDDDENDLEAETDDEEEESDNDGDDSPTQPLYRSRMAFGRPRERLGVNGDVQYSTHSKVYKGHCNTRTVKDVNYYGLNDEYVVSGSDDGNFFIWDHKTCQIVNILEGDGEVVNVVQGHPYEPIIACSGIDSTVKIFGPGGKGRDRYRAARGFDIANPAGSVHSSLRFGRTRRSTEGDEDEAADAEAEAEVSYDTEDEEDALLNPRSGLRSRRAMSRCYQITSQNDVMRREGVGDALITEGMLARFATILQRGELQGITRQGFGGTGGTIVVDDNCTLM